MNERVRAVEQYAKKYLHQLPRRTGESYYLHCLEVATTLSEIVNDDSLCVVALLHDILLVDGGKQLLEASPTTEEEKVLIRSMSQLRGLYLEENMEEVDRVIESFLSHPELIPLRMAHRINDVRNLERFDRATQRKVASETLHMYTPIAARLGFHKWRYEMEDRCFLHLHPKTAAQIQELYQINAKKDQKCITMVQDFLRQKLEEKKMSARFTSRIKNIYSTYRKMVVKKRSYEELTDRLAIRIIVPSREDCYQVLGVIHSAMHPVPGKLKDYIGAPKENGYRSIHTVVYPLPGVTEEPIEIQIRSEQMEQECAFGVAMHANYKERAYALSSLPTKVNLARNFKVLRSEIESPKEFEKALQTYYATNKLLVFDSNNDMYYISRSSSVLDFVIQVHEKRAMKLKQVKVNGRIVPLQTPLKDGNVIELKFGRKNEMSKKWSGYCTNPEHKNIIKGWTKTRD